MGHCLVLTTCPDANVAQTLARTLVTEHLAACINILPGARSIYEWDGVVMQEEEVVLLIKSRSDRLAALEARVREEHPYELPEFIAVPIVDGLAPYLSWIDSQLEK